MLLPDIVLEDDKPMKRPAVGVAVVVIQEGKILLGRRKSSHGTGSWSCPGGHLEFSETIVDCAKREVFEETGIRIGNIRYGPFTNDVFVAEGKHYVTLFVVADYADGTVQVREPEKDDCWGWYRWDHLPQPLFLPLQNLLALGVNLTDLTERSMPAARSKSSELPSSVTD
jgi:8-oxo-dGTP diphosphatase